MAKYRVVYTRGTSQGPPGDTPSEHATVAEAFAALDAMSAQMVRADAPSDGIELVVVNERGDIVLRPKTH
jgi:hypothetical protein